MTYVQMYNTTKYNLLPFSCTFNIFMDRDGSQFVTFSILYILTSRIHVPPKHIHLILKYSIEDKIGDPYCTQEKRWSTKSFCCSVWLMMTLWFTSRNWFWNCKNMFCCDMDVFMLFRNKIYVFYKRMRICLQSIHFDCVTSLCHFRPNDEQLQNKQKFQADV